MFSRCSLDRKHGHFDTCLSRPLEQYKLPYKMLQLISRVVLKGFERRQSSFLGILRSISRLCILPEAVYVFFLDRANIVRGKGALYSNDVITSVSKIACQRICMQSYPGLLLGLLSLIVGCQKSRNVNKGGYSCRA